MNPYFEAPWETSLTVMTVAATILCVGVGVFLIWWGRSLVQVTKFGAVTCLLIGLVHVLAPVPFALGSVRGYSVSVDAVTVHHFFGQTELSLADLVSVEVMPNAVRGSVRVRGTGGFFRYSGHWRSQRLGDFRIFATDRERTVVLKFEEETIVLSPENPGGFVRAVERAGKEKNRS